MNTLAYPIDNGLISGDGLSQLLAKYIAQSGVVEPAALTVAPLDSPDMKVQISGSTNDDHLVVLKPSGGYLVGWNLEPFILDIAPNVTGVTKTDAIVAYFDLTAGDDDIPEAPNGLSFMTVRKPAAETGAPDDGAIDSVVGHEYWHRLGNQEVPHNATSISGGFTDTRAYAGINGALLQALSVTTPKIASSAVTTPKIANASVTNAKLATAAGELGGEALTWAPTVNASGSMTISAVDIRIARFKQIGKHISFTATVFFTTGGSASTDILLSLPLAPDATNPIGVGGITVDGSGNILGAAAYISSSGMLTIKKYNNSNWGIGSGRQILVQGEYQIP